MPMPAAREVAVTILHPREATDANSHPAATAIETDITGAPADARVVVDPEIVAEIDLIDALKGMYFCG
ncbi:MAG: hypothetical protein OEM97_11620 [Acidimicrobiia bacterium]|nr:hypothetical protein [Acidimicrobiia bacterium]